MRRFPAERRWLPARRERPPSFDRQAPQRVRISGLTKTYPGADHPAVANLSLDIEPGSFFSLLGPSGCGKTTIMRCIAGLEKPDQGEIWIDDSLVFSGERGVDVPSYQRQMGMVFQSYAIWPHKTVFGNVVYPLKNLGIGRAEIARRVSEVLQTVGLHAKSNSSATLLSGGEQQRVALARAIVARPRLLLLDEPLSNLDAKLREQMRFELGRLQQLLGITTIYVTHDQHEAFSMSGSMAILHSGKIVELGDPETVYRTPASLAGAQFLGTSARFRGRVLSATDQAVRVDTPLGPIDCRGRVTPPPGAEVWVCLRPEGIQILPGTETPPGLTSVEAQVTQVAFHGSTYEWWAEANGIAVPGHSPADSPEGDLLREATNHNVRLGISRAICIFEQPDTSGYTDVADDVQQSASNGASSSMSTASA